ncbi:hypothetical protein M9H77_34162 [Catharanthus roseus]|uniref:Uncharacterized protein n=1 Tax=Catharanthus roseus TaxID=4058 RepID=A0ACB9ZKF8_CATRO|nr:hypothetical protein M9H77_34162 [Catharanthus roseus]
MRFRDLYAFNLALLAKQAWKVISEPQSLLSRVLKGTYFPSTSILQATSKVEGLNLLKRGIRWSVGTRLNINAWHSPWILTPHSFKPLPYYQYLAENLRVADLIFPKPRSWIILVLQYFFQPHKVEANLTYSILSAS